MLQPKIYPELIGRALVLDADPFVVMVEDDNPWVEGLFLTVSLGFLIGVAHWVGSLLLTATLPPADAMLEAILQGWQRFSQNIGGADPVAVEASIRQTWTIVAAFTGYGGGWFRLFTLVATPFSLLIQWLLAGLIIFAVGRALGGRGTLNQTMGATALMVAPHAFSLLTAIPFVSVSGLLLLVWSLLINYRAAEVVHELPWPRASLVALAPVAILILLAFFVSFVLGSGLVIGGAA